MNITIIGTGYVGLVTGACFADMGNNVLCLDIDTRKIDQLNSGEIPIYEPGLQQVVNKNAAAGRLKFTSTYDRALDKADVVFIAVGTPSDEDGSADLKHVLAAAREVGKRINERILVVNKSTVPVGTADKVQAGIAAELARRGLNVPFTVVSNPEFLKEGAAVEDFMRPERIIVGSNDPTASADMRRLYAPFNRNHDKMIFMDVRSAELTKYVANAMLATRISFMNEMANLAERLGADIESIRHGIGSDTRIGSHFLYAGCGYGGSCFPKDVRALLRTASDQAQPSWVLDAVEKANELQKQVLFTKLERFYQNRGGIKNRTIALWGLAFKPNTDDMREAASRTLIEQLLTAGANVRAYDPAAMHEAGRIFSKVQGIQLCKSAAEAVRGSDALVVVTEWQEFRSPDFAALKNELRDQVIFDGRNLYSPQEVKQAGLAYFGIGR